MSIKPMDMQVLLPNIKKATRPGYMKDIRDEATHQQNHIKEKTEAETKKNKVSNLEKKGLNDIKSNKEKKSGQHQKEKKNKDKTNDEQELKVVDYQHGSNFDIKV